LIFIKKINDIWEVPTRDNRALDSVLFKIKKVNFFRGWGYNLSGIRKKRTKEIQEELATLEFLEEQESLSENQIKWKIELKVEFFHLMEEEELFWFKRCHETWLLKGDNNT
jgi:hypothetical protein